MDGIFNVCKPPGMTSHDVVNVIRRMAKQRRVGHAGTLDPSAEGVLVVCLGKATKVVEYLINDRKVYRAEVALGVSTDTYDADGQPVDRAQSGVLPNGLSVETLESVLSAFRGKISQVPPRYSAIKLRGQPLYKLARAGIEVTPEPREVTIHRLDLLEWQPPKLTILVECSKGTYIRSLANDIGEALCCGGHLHHLLRLASGHFDLDSASTIDALSLAFDEGKAEDLLFALDHALLDYEGVIVDEECVGRVRNGGSWAATPGTGKRMVGDWRPVRVYSVEGEIVAMARYRDIDDHWHPSKVF